MSTCSVHQLNMSMAQRHLKSPRSLSGTSTLPTMVTQRSQSWSWMIHSHPFCTKSISPPIPEIGLFQTLTLKLQGQGHGCGQSAQPYNWPSILLDLFPFCFTSIQSQFLRYSYFEIWPSKIQDQRHGWGQRSRSHSWPRIQPMHLLFVSRHQTNHSWDLSNSVWPSNKANLRDLIAATGLVILLKLD